MGVTFTRMSDEDRHRALAEAPMGDEPKMQFYDGEGHRTSEPKAVVQYLSDDPNRPDAGKGEKAVPASDETVKAVSAPPEDKAVKAPSGTKAAK